ncbi:WD40-repeat-containing domain protein [Gongronella butleri]|nr:WD40-repeat-containing domain protein [Gongronella butleri]
MSDAEFQLKLVDPPTDSITGLHYHATVPNQLLVSSWDKTVRVYDTLSGSLRYKALFDMPLLDACFAPDHQLLTAGLDGSISTVNVAKDTKQVLGKHASGARSIHWDKDRQCAYSGSWDKTLRVWDVRAGTETNKVKLGHKVFSMDLRGHLLGAALTDRETRVFDTRKMSEPLHSIRVPQRHMLKCLRITPDATGMAVASIDGRVCLELFDRSSEADRTFAWRAHRHTLQVEDKDTDLIKDTEVVYPVNALAFHPIHGTLATGGSDCTVFVWNTRSRRRLRQFTRFNEEIAQIDIDPTGSQLAVASSYTFDEGPRRHAPDTIYIRTLKDADFRPKTK